MLQLTPSSPQQATRPAITLFWGWAGVVPFAALAGAAAWADTSLAVVAKATLIPYAAIILTFMGGVHWGFAIYRSDPDAWLYTAGILPSLVAVAAIVLPAHLALSLLGVGFIALLLFDLRLVRRSVALAWYGELRAQLTLAVVACLAVAGFA